MSTTTARRAGPLLLVIAAACLVYANSLFNGFAFDDVAIIRDNARVHQLADLREIWLTPYWPYFGVELGLWRPLVIFLYAVQWSLGDGSPWVFHAVSIALHAGVTLLVFLLLARLTNRTAAFAGALVFAVHPLHTEAVANVVGQAELLAALGLVGACLLHAARPPGSATSWGRSCALVALFAVAILSKEHAVVLPALLVAVDLAQRRIVLSRRGLLAYIEAAAMPMLLLACTLALYLTFRYDVLAGTLLGTEAGPQLHFLREEFRLLNALRAFPELLRLIFFPLDLSADYAPAMILPVESLTLMTVIGALLLAATTILALMTPWHPAAGFPAAWFLITVLTVSNLLFPIGVLIAERTLYLPSMAVSAVVACAWAAEARQPQLRLRRVLVPAALTVIVILAGIRTWTRNPDWKSTQTVLYSVLRDHPESYKAQWTHANWQWQLGHENVARYHYELAWRIYPNDSQLLTEYANFLLDQGETDRALQLLERAFELHSYVPRTTLMLGTAYLAAGRYSDALDMADHAVDIGLSQAASMPLRAAALEGMGDDDRAFAVWQYVVRHSALGNPAEWALLARKLARDQHPDEARRALQRGRHAAAGDASVLALMDRVDHEIALGCHDAAHPATSGTDSAGGCPDAPAVFIPGLQNANVLRNAILPDLTAPVPGGVDGM